MSYFRGLDAAPPTDPWAGPGPIESVTAGIASAANALSSGIASLFGKAVAAPAPTVAHPAPLTAAEQAKLLGSAAPVVATLPGGGGSSKMLPIVAVLALGGVGAFFLLRKKRPTSNPARRRRKRRR